MVDIKILKPSKTAMSSGKAKTHQWKIDFNSTSGKYREFLMGWTGTTDNRYQSDLFFKTKEDAIAFAEKHQLSYEIEEVNPFHLVPKSYGDNFKAKKIHT